MFSHERKRHGECVYGMVTRPASFRKPAPVEDRPILHDADALLMPPISR